MSFLMSLLIWNMFCLVFVGCRLYPTPSSSVFMRVCESCMSEWFSYLVFVGRLNRRGVFFGRHSSVDLWPRLRCVWGALLSPLGGLWVVGVVMTPAYVFVGGGLAWTCLRSIFRLDFFLAAICLAS